MSERDNDTMTGTTLRRIDKCQQSRIIRVAGCPVEPPSPSAPVTLAYGGGVSWPMTTN
jgi:hypothetical protein